MKPNTSYGVRPVTAREIADACGSARRALELTGGDETTALFLLHNPAALNRVVDKPVPQLLTSLATELRELRDQQDATAIAKAKAAGEAELRRRAQKAWGERHTYSAVMKACEVGRVTAKKLVKAIEAA